MNRSFFEREEIPDMEDPSRIYLRRWYVLPWRTGIGIKLHHILLPDSVLRPLHDHPWWFLSLRLKGRYVEVTAPAGRPEVTRERRQRFIMFHRATDLHFISEITPKGAWTLVFNGPVKRTWGFHPVGGTWRSWKDELGLNNEKRESNSVR